MQPRDSVGDMQAPAHDLSWDEADRWVLELGYRTQNGDADWREFLDDIGIGTVKDTLKHRWTKGKPGEKGGAALGLRRDIRKALERLERARKTPTVFGSALLALEEWSALGAAIAVKKPELIHAETERLRQLAADVLVVDELDEAREAAEARIAAAMTPLSEIRASPKPSGVPEKTRRGGALVSPTRPSKST